MIEKLRSQRDKLKGKKQKKDSNDKIIEIYKDIAQNYLFGNVSLNNQRRFYKEGGKLKVIETDRSRLLEAFENYSGGSLIEWSEYVEFCLDKWKASGIDSHAMVGFVCSEKLFRQWEKERE